MRMKDMHRAGLGAFWLSFQRWRRQMQSYNAAQLPGMSILMDEEVEMAMLGHLESTVAQYESEVARGSASSRYGALLELAGFSTGDPGVSVDVITQAQWEAFFGYVTFGQLRTVDKQRMWGEALEEAEAAGKGQEEALSAVLAFSARVKASMRNHGAACFEDYGCDAKVGLSSIVYRMHPRDFRNACIAEYDTDGFPKKNLEQYLQALRALAVEYTEARRRFPIHSRDAVVGKNNWRSGGGERGKRDPREAKEPSRAPKATEGGNDGARPRSGAKSAPAVVNAAEAGS